MFRNFIAFSILAKFKLQSIASHSLLGFLEFLASNSLSHSVISHYISAVKTKLSMYGLDISAFSDPRICYFNKAIATSAPLKVSIKPIIDIPLLTEMAAVCDSMFMGFVCKAAILLSFFSFLRISNLVPHSMSTFTPLRQLAQGDIFFTPPGAQVLLKWSKAIQMNNSVRLIKIPYLGSSPICPVKALKKLRSLTPSGSNKLLFQVKFGDQWVPLSDTRLRKQFSLILSKLKLRHTNITFHSLRRSGATCAFNSNVSLQNIQSQGTWTSECVWSYITQDHQASDDVALTFQRVLHA